MYNINSETMETEITLYTIRNLNFLPSLLSLYNHLRHHAVSMGKWLPKFWTEIAASNFRVGPSSLREEGNAKNLHANATFITYV
jgi:hypothetical protein